MNISQLISQVLLLYTPAIIANMAPVFAHRYNLLLWLNKPIDFGMRIGDMRLFGSHKTIRGFVVGTAASALSGLLLWFFIHERPYASVAAAMLYGGAVGFAALAGDAIKSFFKRRMHIYSGRSWILFDQIDFVIGATVAVKLFIDIPLSVLCAAIILLGVSSYIVSTIGIALHLKRTL